MASTVTSAFIGCNGMTNIMAHLDSKGVSTVKPMSRKRKSMQEQAKVAAKPRLQRPRLLLKHWPRAKAKPKLQSEMVEAKAKMAQAKLMLLRLVGHVFRFKIAGPHLSCLTPQTNDT